MKLVSDYRYDVNYYFRYGQILFNVLYINWPEIANDIRGTDKDPFHCEKWEEEITKFFEELCKYEDSGPNHQTNDA